MSNLLLLFLPRWSVMTRFSLYILFCQRNRCNVFEFTARPILSDIHLTHSSSDTAPDTTGISKEISGLTGVAFPIISLVS